MLLTIIVPCYNESAVLPYFFQEIRKTTEQLAHDYALQTELIFVDDGSRDATLALLREAAANGSRVHYLSFSRNFGKEAAIYAGLKRATGDFVVLMDADLQDPPALLPQMYEALRHGEYDSVATRRSDRTGEPPIRSFFAKMFYKLMNSFSDSEVMDGARDFRMMNRKMVDAVLSMGEYNRFTKGIFGFVGFKTKWLPYENVQRVAGETKWSFWKLCAYALQGITAFSTAPLMIALVLGLLFCVAAFVMIIYIIIKTLIFGDPVGGWPSMACMVLFMGGCSSFASESLGSIWRKLIWKQNIVRSISFRRRILRASSPTNKRANYHCGAIAPCEDGIIIFPSKFRVKAPHRCKCDGTRRSKRPLCFRLRPMLYIKGAARGIRSNTVCLPIAPSHHSWREP